MVCGGLWWFAMVCGISTDRYRNPALTRPCAYAAMFFGCKNDNFPIKHCDNFSYMCSKHNVWVHVRTASFIEVVLASTHNPCFRAK